MARVLVVLSGADHWTLRDGSKHSTGFWAQGLVCAHRALTGSGHRLTLATPGGATPALDPIGLAPGAVGGVDPARELTTYLATLSRELTVPAVLEEQRPGDHDAIYLPGGHACMEDLVESAALGRLLVAAVDAGRPVTAVAHGAAGLVPAVRADGGWAFAGRRMAVFTDVEEELGGLAPAAPWLLEPRLDLLGAILDTGLPWAPHVVSDRGLVTGQNPGSSEAAATVTAELLGPA
jgi:putative intracellular protease/amidase